MTLAPHEQAALIRIEAKLNTLLTTRCTCKTCRDDPRVDRVVRALCSAFDTVEPPVQETLREQARRMIAAMEVTR